MHRHSVGALLFRLRALVALFILVVAFAMLSDAFLTTSNLIILVKHVAINAILAIGMTFVILTGGIDLSVGSVAGLAGMIAGGLISEGLVLESFGVKVYFHVWLVVVIALLAGMAVGALNGLLVTRFRVAPPLPLCEPRIPAGGTARSSERQRHHHLQPPAAPKRQ